MKLFRKIKEVITNQKNDKGEIIKKRYTNFYLGIEVNGQMVYIPIQPVRFNDAQNRRNYSLLSYASLLVTDDEMPF